MVLALQPLIAYWRGRLEWLDQRVAEKGPGSWAFSIERRVVAFFLHRFGDPEPPELPEAAFPLDPASAKASDRLWLRKEVAERLNNEQTADGGIGVEYGLIEDRERRWWLFRDVE